MDEMSNKFETDSEISMSIFEVRSSDEEITSANNRFSKADGYHTVPPPIIGNFLTPRANISFASLDEFAIRKKIIKSKTTELKTATSKSKTSETVGNTNEVNIETPKSVYESVVSTPNINREKVIIEDWNSDDKDDVSEVIPKTQTVKTQVDKIGQISKKEGIGFKKIKACFICKSIGILIRDCDFHEKRMAKQVELNKLKVNDARQNLSSQATTTSTARKVNTARPIVNEIRLRNNLFKSHSPNRRPTASKSNPIKVNGVNTAKGNAVKSNVKGNWENVVKPSARYEWRPINVLDNVSKDSASMILKRVDYIDAHGRSKFIKDVITKTIEYCLFDVVVGFHRLEARLEDNRSTTTIAKPNDLVHVQHLEETTFHKSNKVKETEARVEATVHKEKATTEKEETIKETADTLTSLQSEVASLEAKGFLDANEEIKKDHTLVHELEKQVKKLLMELQLKNNVRGALETKDLKKMMIDLNPTLHDLQEVKTKYALKIDDEEFKKAKSEATRNIRKLEKVYDAWLPPWLVSRLVVYQPYVKNHWKEFMFIQERIWDPRNQDIF
ncbi:hypothetical protein Tco_1502942 [Tanacetum coccineum]